LCEEVVNVIMNKVFSSFEEAVADIPDGASIMVGGFGGKGSTPQNLILALSKRNVNNLTIIGNSPFISEFLGGVLKSPYVDCNLLLNSKQVRKVIASFPIWTLGEGRKSLLVQMALAGEVEVEIVPQGTLAERIRAGGGGIAGFYTPSGVGTLLARGKETKVFDGREYLLERGLTADYSFVRAHKADLLGNLIYKGTSRTFNPIMATAASVTIAEVNKIVNIGDLDPEHVITPGVYVKRIVEIPVMEA
jgi:3-oxoacid CoA-transferase subunit A